MALPPVESVSGGHRYRTAAIDAFLDSLSTWEGLYLRSQIRRGRCPIRLGDLASLVHLPPEVVSIIAVELFIEDVFACQAVSRAWRHTWMSDAVSRTCCRHFFPGLLEAHAHESGAEKAPLSATFRQEATNYLRWHHGRPRCRGWISWDPRWGYGHGPESDPTPFRNTDSPPAGGRDFTYSPTSLGFQGSFASQTRAVYGGGKLAWRAGETRVLVDDLFSMRRRVCAIGQAYIQGENLRLVAVSDHFVVFSGREHGRRPIARIWHMDLREWQVLALPASMAHCYPDDHRVAFVLSNSQVLLWEWNGILTELKPNHISDPQQQSKLSIPGVIWHPQLRHTFYVCQLRMTHIDTQGGEVIVIKYVNGKADKEFYFQVEHPGKTFLTHVPGLQSFKCGLSIQRTNPWGAWQIAIAHAYGQAHTGPNTVRAYTRSYMFDVYSESFRQLEFDTAFGDRTALFASPGYLVADDRGNLSQSSGLPWGVHWQDRLVTISGMTPTPDEVGSGPTLWMHGRADVAITNQPSTEREQQILANNDLTRRPSQYAEVLGDGRVLLVLGDNGFVVWAWEDMPEMPLFDDCHD